MKHLIMDKPQCLLYSAAMVLDITPSILILCLGHDGMEEWWPQYPDHRKYRSHSMQEMIDIALANDKALVPIHGCPMQSPAGACIDARPTFESPVLRFKDAVKGRRAIIIGKTENGNPHAWAWDGYNLYDPRGGRTSIEDISIEMAWVMFNINSDQ